MTGTYFVNVAGTFLGAYFVLTVSIVAQIIWRSIFPKEET
jgi:fluoride ion exporter CrcB/FEX